MVLDATIEHRLPGADDWTRHQLSDPLSAFRDETKRYRSESLDGTVHEEVVGPRIVSADLQLADVPPEWQELGVQRVEARYQHPGRVPIACEMGFHSSWKPGDDPARVVLVGGAAQNLLWKSAKSSDGPARAEIPNVAISRDGQWAMGLNSMAGRVPAVGFDVDGGYAMVVLTTRKPPVRMPVMWSGTFRALYDQPGQTRRWGLPFDQGLGDLVLLSLGEFLDQNPVPEYRCQRLRR